MSDKNIVFLKLYITDDVNNGFYNSQEIGLAKALIAAHPEHHVHIVLLSKSVSAREDSEVSERLFLHVLPGKGVGHHGMPDLDILKELKADLVHLLADNMLYAPNVISYCQKNGIKYHLYIGTLFTDSSNPVKKMVSKLLMSRNIRAYQKSPVYVKTPSVQKQCEDLGIKAKLAPVGLSREDAEGNSKSEFNSALDIRKKYNLPQNKKLLLFVGRLEEYKHPADALELLSTLDDSFNLVIVGSGILEADLKKNISEDKSLRGRVLFMSKIPNSEMRFIYNACDYFVNFNPDEIYGMSILEAMCHGCPVFAIKAPGPEFIIKDASTGFLCNNIDEMRFGIDNLDSDDESKQAIIQAARRFVLDNLVWDKLINNFDDF